MYLVGKVVKRREGSSEQINETTKQCQDRKRKLLCPNTVSVPLGYSKFIRLSTQFHLEKCVPFCDCTCSLEEKAVLFLGKGMFVIKKGE